MAAEILMPPAGDLHQRWPGERRRVAAWWWLRLVATTTASPRRCQTDESTGIKRWSVFDTCTPARFTVCGTRGGDGSRPATVRKAAHLLHYARVAP